MTTLWVLLHVVAQRDYELHSLDFSAAFLHGSLQEEIWLRREPGFTGSSPTVYVDDLVFVTTNTEALALVNTELQERHTCTDQGELRSYLCLQITRERARRTDLCRGHGCTGATLADLTADLLGGAASFSSCSRRRQLHLSYVASRANTADVFTKALGSGDRQPLLCFVLLLDRSCDRLLCLLSTRSSSVSTSTAEAEIYAGAMASQELRWLIFLLTDLAERSSSAPTLFTDNKT
ncbi:unnamed protein product [Closterium sp. NIES-53]